jgi:hypothetical protein
MVRALPFRTASPSSTSSGSSPAYAHPRTNPPGGNATAAALTDRVLVSQGAVDRSATLLQQVQTALGVGGGGGGTLTAASVRAATGARIFNVKAEFGGTFDGSPHPLSEVYGTNLTAAQAAFPLVSGLALTDFQDYAAIQQAINTAALNDKGGIVALYSGEVAVINKQIDLFPANCVSLKGFPRAIIRTESCGTTAALLVRESYEAWPVHAVENIDFQALNFGRGGASPAVAGTAVAGAAPGAGGLTWRIGATAILYRHCYNVVVRRIAASTSTTCRCSLTPTPG